MEKPKQGDVKIGDHVRRRGILAEMFGDEEGTVVDVKHDPGSEDSDEFEVMFGTRFVMCSSQQIILSQPYSSVTQPRLALFTKRMYLARVPRSDL